MNKCELCKSPAQTYCESDQAILCWDCDAKVHGANFLVARHSRTLLCNHCKSPTPWTASGARLGRTVSVCHGCATERCEGEESEGANDGDLDTDADNDEEDEDASEFEGEEEEDRDEEGENQVVPWSSTPPPPSSSSSEDDFPETATMFSRKRMRDNSRDLHSLNDDCCSSSHLNNRSKSSAEAVAEGEETFADSLKRRRDKGLRRLERNGSTSTVILQ